MAKGHSSYVQYDFDTTSDCSSVLVTILLGTRVSHVEPKLRFSNIDEKTFQYLLLSSIAHLKPLQNKSLSHIKNIAEGLISQYITKLIR